MDNNILTFQRNNLDAILNSITDAVLAVDANENIIEANPPALKWLKLKYNKVVGWPLHAVISDKTLQNFIKNALKLGAPQTAAVNIFLENEHVLSVKSSPIYDADNNINGCLIAFLDITKTRHFKESRRYFVSNVSHEIKTPLTVIKGSTEIIRKTLSEQGECHAENLHFLEIIDKHTQRLMSIIDGILLLARIEREAVDLTRSTSLLQPIISTVLNALEAKITAKNIIIALNCPPDLSLCINSELVRHALQNLLDNAVNHSEPGHTITITAAVNNAVCRISVADKGTGIDRKHFDCLFERFYRVDEARSRKIGGPGLGLAVVQYVAQAHNGRVEIESEPGFGSTFTLVLPLA